MTNRRTHQFVAFACSVVMTLTIFSSVASLSSPDHAGQWVVQSTQTQPAHG
jgi:hypothetical protein